MSLFLLSRNAAAFVPAARSIVRTSNARIAAPIAANYIFQSSKLFMSTAADTAEIEALIEAKGNEIRQLKADGVDKASLAPHVQELLALKAKLAPEEKAPAQKKAPQKPTKEKQPPKKNEADMSDSELRQARLAKVAAMREAGVEPYAYSYKPTHSSMELQDLYDGKLEGGEEDETADVAVAGRIMAKRVFGKLAFFTLQDESGTIQLHLEKNRLGDSFKVSYCLSLIFQGIRGFLCPLNGSLLFLTELESMGRCRRYSWNSWNCEEN